MNILTGRLVRLLFSLSLSLVRSLSLALSISLSLSRSLALSVPHIQVIRYIGALLLMIFEKLSDTACKIAPRLAVQIQ